MHVGEMNRPPHSPQEGWISDGRQVRHGKPFRYDRWSQSLEVTVWARWPTTSRPGEPLSRSDTFTVSSPGWLPPWVQICCAAVFVFPLLVIVH
jgi:hypothetical protein